MEKRLFMILMMIILFSSLVRSSNHFTKSSSKHHLDSTSSTDSTSSSSSSTDSSSSESSTTSSSSSDVWMYGTCFMSSLFLLVVLIYVCYNCSKFCKISSRYGAKGGNTQFSNEQEMPAYEQYGNYVAGAGPQNYTQGAADPYAQQQQNYKYGY